MATTLCHEFSGSTLRQQLKILLQMQGNINRGEPAFIQTLRGEMRVLHYAYATEKAYVRWIKRFSGHVGSDDLDQFHEIFKLFKNRNC